MKRGSGISLLPISLKLVTQTEQPILENLVQLYSHECSSFHPREIADDGRFDISAEIPNPDDEHHIGILVLVKGKLAGFAVIRREAPATDHYRFDCIFMLESYRRLGMGEEVVRMIIDSYAGTWTIPVHHENRLGLAFWKHVCYRYSGDDFEEMAHRNAESVLFRMRSPGPRPNESGVRAEVSRFFGAWVPTL